MKQRDCIACSYHFESDETIKTVNFFHRRICWSRELTVAGGGAGLLSTSENEDSESIFFWWVTKFSLGMTIFILGKGKTMLSQGEEDSEELGTLQRKL